MRTLTDQQCPVIEVAMSMAGISNPVVAAVGASVAAETSVAGGWVGAAVGVPQAATSMAIAVSTPAIRQILLADISNSS